MVVAGGGGSNAHVVLASRLLGGDPPDVWQTPGASIKQYIDAGQIADVSSIYQRDNLSSAIRQDLRQAVSKDGKEYGVSTGAHRINMLWSNKRPARGRPVVACPLSGEVAFDPVGQLVQIVSAMRWIRLWDTGLDLRPVPIGRSAVPQGVPRGQVISTVDGNPAPVSPGARGDRDRPAAHRARSACRAPRRRISSPASSAPSAA